MPNITINLNKDNVKAVDKACEKEKLSRYAFCKKAVLEKLEKGDEPVEREGKNDSGVKEGRQRTLAVGY